MAEQQSRPGPPQAEHLIEESRRNRITFLRTELQIAFTLLGLAETEWNLGDPGHAARSLEHAERAYATLVHFMSDRKHLQHMTEDERAELSAGIARLRAQLDKLGRK